MTRKSVLFGVGGVALLLGSVASALALLVLHEPGFYSRSALPPGPVRKQHSKAFVAEFSHLFNGIYNLYPEWYGTFTDAQINSYLEEARTEYVEARHVVYRAALFALDTLVPGMALAFDFAAGQEAYAFSSVQVPTPEVPAGGPSFRVLPPLQS